MRSKRSHEGYLYIDPGAGPSVSLEQARKFGRAVVGAGARGPTEYGILTCSHCQAQVMINPMRTRDRGYCQKCDHYICDNPACHAGCLPMKRVLDAGMDAAQLNQDVDGKIRDLRRSILGT